MKRQGIPLSEMEPTNLLVSQDTDIPNIATDKNNIDEIDFLEDCVYEFTSMVYKDAKTTNTCCNILCYFCCACKCICIRNRCKSKLTSKIYSSSTDTLFGDLTQCGLIMEKNFGGKQFKIPSIAGAN